jgi:hypothetical protein
MTKRLSQEEFLHRCFKKHGNKYDYSKSKYLGLDHKIVIVCPKHGRMEQDPENHLKGHGCVMCYKEIEGSNRNSNKEEFILKANKIHDFIYKYDRAIYVNAKTTLIVTCEKHGDFTVKPFSHLSGQACPICTKERVMKKRRKSNDVYISDVNKVHKNKYLYTNTEYISVFKPIVVTCKIHGDFTIKASDHISGVGCRECYLMQNNFIKKSWIERSGDKVGTFYIIRCFNENESFYKFGITYNGLSSRYARKKDMPYNYEIVRLIISSDVDYVWSLEKRFSAFKFRDRYTPNITFAGSKTECFKSYNKIDRVR